MARQKPRRNQVRIDNLRISSQHTLYKQNVVAVLTVLNLEPLYQAF